MLLAALLAISTWRTPDPAHLLVIDTSRGRVVIELEPRAAPKAVERVSLLARRGTYDGLLFHRVITGFVAQTGNPNNRDGGGTELPNLAPEFSFRLPAAMDATATRGLDSWSGLVGSLPVVANATPGSTGTRRAWGAQCRGTIGMGRQADPASANSEIYIPTAPARMLDHDYTLFGRVIAGMAAVDALAVGEPPAQPDRMIRVRVVIDMPPAEQPRLQVMDPRSPAFARLVAQARSARGADFSVCDLPLPVQGTAGG